MEITDVTKVPCLNLDKIFFFSKLHRTIYPSQLAIANKDSFKKHKSVIDNPFTGENSSNYFHSPNDLSLPKY
jgi:hypothetical protein